MIRRFLTRRYLQSQRLAPVLVHLDNEKSLRGFVREAAADALVLADAEYLSESGNTGLAGDVAIPHGRIDFVQVLDRA